MTHFELVPFGAGTLPVVSGSLVRTANQMQIAWHVDPRQHALVWPSEERILRRQDGLWKSTCFEIFVAASATDSSPVKPYFEINISPSGNWQCYRFDDYRQAQSVSNTFAVTQSSASHHAEHCSLSCTVEYSLPQFVTTSLNISISAILEMQPARTSRIDVAMPGSSELTYYALTHPSKQPDFHLASSRLLKLYTDEPI